MMKTTSYSLQTKLLHHRHKTDPTNGAVSVPVQHATTFHQEKVDAFGEFDYARSGNPTRQALEETIAELEGAAHGFAFASGMAAISTALFLLKAGDHAVVTEDVYGGTFRFVSKVLTRNGVHVDFVDATNVEEVAAAIRPETKVIYVETPSNPTLKITPLQAIASLARAHGIITICDNTFMTPLYQRPLELGIDIVVHSATKFLSGHSDVLAGLAVTNRADLAEELRFLQNSLGATLGPDDCWLVMRGMKTLHARLSTSTASATILAQWLSFHPAVKHVYYPGLATHEGRSVHQSQSTSGGAVLAFELKNASKVKQVVERIQLPVFAVSLGAVESILSYPKTMSHAAMTAEERAERGISDGLLRLSVGLEQVEDLQEDLARALQ